MDQYQPESEVTDENLHRLIDESHFTPADALLVVTAATQNSELQIDGPERGVVRRGFIKATDIAFSAVDKLLTVAIERRNKKNGELPHYRSGL